jgi:exopolysaccharide production protein ExoQ
MAMTQIVGSRWHATPKRWRNSKFGMARAAAGNLVSAAHATQVGYFETGLALAAVSGLVSISVVGNVGSLVFVIASLSLLVLRMRQVGPAVIKFWPLFLLPGLAILSTLWSDAPPITMRAALELMITFIFGITFAKLFSVQHAIKICLVPFFIICFASFPLIVLAIARKAPIIGLLGSKNALGFTAAMLLTLAAVIFCSGYEKKLVRIIALGAIGGSLLVGYFAHSVGAQLNMALVVVMIVSFYFLRLLPTFARVILTCIILVVTVGTFVIISQSPKINGLLAGAVGKDATLTGRTDLWRKAFAVGSQSPIVGHGYSVFWRIGNLDAEQMWRKFGIAGRSGFNFHNTLVDMYVDLGALGVGLLVLTCVSVFTTLLYRQIAQPSWANDALMTILISIIFRHFAETGLISPFSYYAVFLVFIAVYAVGGGIGSADGMLPLMPPRPRIFDRAWRLGKNLRW